MASAKKGNETDLEIKAQGVLVVGEKRIPVYSVISYPQKYESFDVLKGAVLEEVEGNRLRVKRDGTSTDHFIHESFDAIYLSRKPGEPNEDVIAFDLAKDEKFKPFEEFIGKEISYVGKSFSRPDDKVRDLPENVKICVKGLPHCYRIRGDDGVIFISKEPSVRFMISRLSQIVAKGDFSKMTAEDIEELREIKRVIRTPIFDEEKLKENYPDFYSKLYGK